MALSYLAWVFFHVQFAIICDKVLCCSPVSLSVCLSVYLSVFRGIELYLSVWRSFYFERLTSCT